MTDRDFDQLVTRYLDGQLSPDEHAALTAALRGNADRQRTFIDLTLTRRTLHEALSAKKPTPVASPSARAASAGRVNRRTLRSFSVAGWSLAAALLLTAAVVTIYIFVTNPQSEIRDPKSHPPVATLIEATGGTLTTPHDFPNEGSQYGPGEYTLDSGTAEFMLTNAVNVKLRGASRLVMRDDMNISLARGSAEFIVPGNARGFTVQLPDGARVVDLGTRFALTTDRGRSYLRVTDGAVRVDVSDHSTLVEAPSRIAIANGTVTPLRETRSLAEMLDMPGIIDAHDGSLDAASSAWQIVATIDGRTPEQSAFDGDPVVALRDDSTRGRFSIHRLLTDRPLSDRGWVFEARLAMSDVNGAIPLLGVRDEGDGGRAVLIGWDGSTGRLGLYQTLRRPPYLKLVRPLGSVSLADGRMRTYRIEKTRVSSGFAVTIAIDGEPTLDEPISYADLPAALDSTNGVGFYGSTPGTSDVQLDHLFLQEALDAGAIGPREPEPVFDSSDAWTGHETTPSSHIQ